MLIDNKRILQSKNSILLQKLQTVDPVCCEVVESKAGVPTLIVTKDGQQLSYHSRYNPVQEAKKFIESQVDASTQYVLFIGAGLGYGLQQLKEQFPKVKFSVYEPNLEIMHSFLANFDLSKVKSKNLDYVFSTLDEVDSLTVFFDDLAHENAKIIVNPIASRLYTQEIDSLINRLKNYLSEQKSSVITDLVFQLRWTTNAIVNFGEILQSPNFFKDINVAQFKDKPVLLVAAGPSLDDELENIRTIKAKGTAYIFAVGSAVNTLINANILPDALFSYDPSEKNATVVEKVKNLNLSIPLIFGSSIGHEVLKDYPGEKFHFLMTQDSFNTHLISNVKDSVIPDAPTIAAVALYIVGELQMGPIILVGQNLSVTKEKTYASGIEYVDTTMTDEMLARYSLAVSTTNTEIYVDQNYAEMGSAIEIIIRSLNMSEKVINTTVNGLPIAGTTFIPLNQVMQTYLVKENIVDTSLFRGQNSYDVEMALTNFEELESNFDTLIKNFKKVVEVEEQIREAYEKKILINAPTLFSEYDKYFGGIERNEFFTQVLSRITRVQYNQLLKDARQIRFEKRPLIKMKRFLESYPKYLRALYVAIYEIQPAFAELKKSDLFKKEDSQ
ncbi:MAG: 6-hydroxymethylpterin diphosphokinase MptE-like protein [Solibacillus sp.]